MKRILLIALLLGMGKGAIYAQSAGDYRTRQSGNWSATTTWQLYDGVNWNNTTTNPNATTANVTIRNGDSVNLNFSQRNVANLTIEGGARLYSSGGSNRFLLLNDTGILVNGSLGRYSTVGSSTNDTSVSVSLRGGPNTLIHGSGTVQLNRLNRAGAGTGDINLEIDIDMELTWNGTAIFNDETGFLNLDLKSGRTINIVNPLGAIGIDGNNGGSADEIGGQWNISGSLLVAGICYCRTNNTLAGGVSVGKTIKNGGLLRCGEVFTTAANGTIGYYFHIENGGTLQVTGNHGPANNTNQFFTYANGSIVEYIGSTAQNVACPDTFSILRFGGNNGKTLQYANAIINDTLQILGSADANKGSYNYIYGSNGTLCYSDNYTPRITTVNEYPATAGPANLVVDNAGDVMLHQSVNVKELTFTKKFGFLRLNDFTLTVDSTIRDTARLKGTYGSSLVIQGNGNHAIIRILRGSPNDRLLNFTLNRAAGASFVSAFGMVGTLTHTLGTITTNGNLTLRYFNRNLYGQIAGTGSGTISGNINMVTRIEGGAGWRPIGSVFNNTVGSYNGSISLFYGTNPANNIQQFREDWGIPHWRAAANSSAPMNVNTAYSFYVQAMTAPHKPSALPMTLTGKGTYRGTGDVTHTNLTRTTGAHTTADTTGWHYRTNPFPSGLLWTPGDYTNVQGNAYYIWRDSANVWGSWNGTTGTNGVNALIPPFAVPLFKVSSATNTVAFKNSHRTTDRNNYFLVNKKAPENEVHLIASAANGSQDELIAYSTYDASFGMDNQDVPKWMNPEGSLNLYALPAADLKAAINLMPRLNNKSYRLPVVFNTTEAGSYTISGSIANLEQGYSIWLEDVKGNKLVSLDQPYRFNFNPNSGNYHFVLHYKYAADAEWQPTFEIAESSEVKVIADGMNLRIMTEGINAGNYIVEVVNTAGAIVIPAHKVAELPGTYSTTVQGPEGIYLVRVSDGQHTSVHRVFMHR